MPIRFRCSRCNRLLGIARRKAGSETACPHCHAVIMVPNPGPEDDRNDLTEVEALLNPAGAPASPVPAPAAAVAAPRPAALPTPAPRPAPQPAKPLPSDPAPEPEPLPAEERPLFERDVDSVLGVTHKADDRPDSPKRKSAPTSGQDALSLGPERGHLVISSQKATALVILVVLLLAIAFAAGFLIASVK